MGKEGTEWKGEGQRRKVKDKGDWAVGHAVWHWFALPSLLIIACCDFIERNAPKNFL